MLFRKKLKSRFILTKPFVVKDLDDGMVSPELLTQRHSEMQSAMFNYIEEWCFAHNWITHSNSGPDFVTLEKDREIYDVVSLAYSVVFRQLTEKTYRDHIISVLRDTEVDYTTTRLLQLHSTIASLVDTSFLNLYINRLYHGLEVSDQFVDGRDMTWEEIHKEYPFMWLIFALHTVLQKYPMKIINK